SKFNRTLCYNVSSFINIFFRPLTLVAREIFFFNHAFHIINEALKRNDISLTRTHCSVWKFNEVVLNVFTLISFFKSHLFKSRKNLFEVSFLSFVDNIEIALNFIVLKFSASKLDI